MKIDSVVKFLTEIDCYNSTQMYRGQGREEWLLLPSIARISQESLPFRYDSGWRGVEEDLLNRFKKHAVRFLDKEPTRKIDWMIQAQHHGVPTRLLDWSTNPLKALYFAVENSHHDDSDGKVFLYFPRATRNSSNDIDGEEEQVIIAFHPHFINERVAAQDGCFTLFPFSRRISEETFDPMENGFCHHSDPLSIASIVIAKESKPEIREQLKKLGITDVSMFPDLGGVAKDIRRSFGCI